MRVRVLQALLAALLAGSALPASAAQAPDCGSAEVLCVAADGTAEYRDIQHAVDRLRPGATVWVAPGSYDGFRVTRGGTPDRPARVLAMPGVRIVGTEPASQESIYLENVSWLTLEGFVVERDGKPGIGIGAHDARPETPMRGLVIRNNIVRGSGSTNIYLSQVSDSVVEGNIASGSQTSHGIYLSNAGSDNTTLRGNNCFGNAKNGIHFNGDLASTGDGLQRGLLVEGNIVHDNLANGLNLDGVQASTFRNNLVFGNGRHALRAYAIDGAAGPVALVIVNNTFVDNGGWAVKLSEETGGHTIFNNILGSALGAISAERLDFASDNNIVSVSFSVDGERTVVDLGGWRELGFGAATRALDESPFVDRPRGDYRLRADAAAALSGRVEFHGIAAPRQDLAGTDHRAGATPIGALAAVDSPVRRGR